MYDCCNENPNTRNIPNPIPKECFVESNEIDSTSKGIYATSHDTWKCLLEIIAMLDTFSNEISPRPSGDITKRADPESFIDNINQNCDLAFAIKGDLQRLMNQFRR